MNAFEPIARLIPPALRSALRPPGPTDADARLAAILGVGPGELPELRLGPRLHYRPFEVAKSDGRPRRILAPSPALKALQRRVLAGVLAGQEAHDCATAFEAGSSIVRNARRHSAGRLIASVDLRDFFESTHAGRVRGYLRRLGWQGEALGALLRLTTHRDGLPQGAPTSPRLSNLVNGPLDDRLQRLAGRSGAHYTRYGDDLTFSWPVGRLPTGFTAAVEDVLGRFGYEVQPRKGWRVAPISARPRIAGVVLLGRGRIAVPWEMRLRALGWGWRALFSSDATTRARASGYAGYLRMFR